MIWYYSRRLILNIKKAVLSLFARPDQDAPARLSAQHGLYHPRDVLQRDFGYNRIHQAQERSNKFQLNISSLPVMTRRLRNSQWRTSCMRSLPPLWYQCLSQSKATISSAVKPHSASLSLSGASVSKDGAMANCSEARIYGFMLLSFLQAAPSCVHIRQSDDQAAQAVACLLRLLALSR